MYNTMINKRKNLMYEADLSLPLYYINIKCYQVK